MKTIEQKNRMIAEFMDVIKYRPYGDYVEINGDAYEVEDLNYHTSWDWLMPVIGEVKYSAGESDEITDVLDRIDSGLLGRNIEYTFNSVVEFIEWYNENK